MNCLRAWIIDNDGNWIAEFDESLRVYDSEGNNITTSYWKNHDFYMVFNCGGVKTKICFIGKI